MESTSFMRVDEVAQEQMCIRDSLLNVWKFNG